MRVTIARTLRGIALALAILVGVGFVARQVDLLDRQFVFYPDRELFGTPADVGLAYEDVWLPAADDVTLHGWYVPAQSDITLLWFHGNGGNISHRVDNLLLLQRHLGASIFIFDYRGYGRSEGRPSEEGTYLDAESALEYLHSSHGLENDRIVLFGRSLGAAVAIEMATRHRFRGVILESPFTSIAGMARKKYPYLPVGLLMRFVESRYDSLSKIKGIQSPLMVLHGDMDDTVPMEVGRELFEAAEEPKRFYTIEGASHNDTYWVGGSAYFEALKRFLEDVSAGEG